MNVGSLFSGIGGFDLGLERAGMEVAWQCEADPWCRRVLAKHWPDVPCYEDVVGLEPPYVDVLCGGFPCQDLSYAGKGAGLSGARSGLWREFARIIRVVGPKWVVVENVPALISRGLGVVLGDLAACGYDAEWDCLPASSFGAPHRRDRSARASIRGCLGGRSRCAGIITRPITRAALDGSRCVCFRAGWACWLRSMACGGCWCVSTPQIPASEQKWSAKEAAMTERPRTWTLELTDYEVANFLAPTTSRGPT